MSFEIEEIEDIGSYDMAVQIRMSRLDGGELWGYEYRQKAAELLEDAMTYFEEKMMEYVREQLEPEEGND